jgi:hypothetical protein
VVAAPQLKRVSSASLIDFSAEAEPVAVTKPVSDPFAPTSVIDPFAPVGTTKSVSDPFSAGVHGGTVQSSSTGWATFDVADSPAPPKGYPDVFVASSAHNFSNGPKQSGSNTWHGSSSGAVGDTWAVFGAPPAVPAPAPPPIPEPSFFCYFISTTTIHTECATIDFKLDRNLQFSFLWFSQSATRDTTGLFCTSLPRI